MMLDRLVSWVKGYSDYRNISKIVENERNSGGLIPSIPIMALAVFISFLSGMISYAISSYFSSAAQFSFAVVFLVVLKASLFAFVVLYALFGFMFIFAKLLGGKGSLSSHVYVLAIILLCNNIYSFLFQTLSHIPQISLVLQILTYIIGLYGVYALAQSVRKIHDLSVLRTIVILFLSTVVFILTVVYTLGVITGSPTA